MLLVAFLASLVLHLAGVVVMRHVPVDLAGTRKAPADESVEIALEPDRLTDTSRGEEERPERERIFTTIPERLASDTPPRDDPDQPQYLAMYHALAANPTPGGDALQPSAPRPSESQQVAVRREQLEGAPGVALATREAAEPSRPSPARTPAAAAAAAEERARQERAKAEQERKRNLPFDGGEQGALPVPRAEGGETTPVRETNQANRPVPLEEWWGTTAPSILKRGTQGVPGDRGIDYDQDAQGLQTSGVARVDDYSLNTWEWNYAPWMQAFGNTLMRNWVPPPARRMGLISGKTVLRVIVEKSGVVSLAEIVETEGHQSLHDASRAALLSSSPFAPLPSHFPLEHLEIRLTMFYPEPPR